MACPYFAKKRFGADKIDSTSEKNLMAEDTVSRYSNYLQLNKVIDAQTPLSGLGNRIEIHDEHLFIVTHQTMELWFKQMLHDLNSARSMFDGDFLEERNMLLVISRMHRTVDILKLATNGFTILETMTPQDFYDFRSYLEGGSGFQSFQFRMLEIRIGLKSESRVKYNRQFYIDVFFQKERELLMKAEREPSIFDLVNSWLERTPGLESDGFDFVNKFRFSVNAMLNEMTANAEDQEDLGEKEILLADVADTRDRFQTIFDEERYNTLKERGDRSFSQKALQGALMIFLYREETRFHLPFQLLQCLMDLDGAMTKFRYSHAAMVQRMIGNKVGTGGSSGYLYLRSTCGDRYKVFRDLMSLSSFLVPRDRIPPLSSGMKQSLSVHDWKLQNGTKPTLPDSDADSGVLSTVSRLMRRVSMGSLNTDDTRIDAYRAAGKPESLV